MTQFKDMGLKPEIQKSLEEIGFETPTPIQEKIIPIILSKSQDIIGLAQTGTGKTAAFGLPVLQMLDENNSNTQVLIMAPTRELTLQIASDIKSFCKYQKKVKVVAAFGGARIDLQIKELRQGAHIIVATPGRLLDLIKRKKINLGTVTHLVLDEADEMLKFGFKDEIDAILEKTPDEKTTMLFSATMSRGVAKISGDYMKDPLEVSVGQKNTGADNIDFQYYVVNAKDRYTAMRRLIDINPNIYAIIFCRTRQETKDIADNLIRDGYEAEAIHGDLSQAQRTQVMKRFKDKALKILVATDVASRGIDVKEITHVINYNLPDEVEVYNHRSGRTGRAGKQGISIAIIHSRSSRKLQQIQKAIGKEFRHCRVPTYTEIYETRLDNYISDLKNQKSFNLVTPASLEKALGDLSELSKETLIERLLESQLMSLPKKSRNNDDLNISFQGLSGGGSSSSSRDGKKKSSRREKPEPSRRRERTREPLLEKDKKETSKRRERGTKEKEKITDKKSKSEDRKVTKKKSKLVAKKKSEPKITNPDQCRFYINSGTKFGLNEANLQQFIKAKSKISKIGSIEVMKKFSFFEVKKEHSETILAKLNNAEINGREISVKIAIPSDG